MPGKIENIVEEFLSSMEYAKSRVLMLSLLF